VSDLSNLAEQAEEIASSVTPINSVRKLNWKRRRLRLGGSAGMAELSFASS
jgi:hypothetical protein